MKTEEYALISFESTNHAISAEKYLQEAGIAAKIIPVPTEITAGCGFAIKLDTNDVSGAQEILEYGEYYYIKRCGSQKSATKL